MRSVLRFIAGLTLSILLSLPAFAFQANDQVEIEYGGAWYPGQIKEAKDGKYFISYDGYDSSWDEWVESSRLRKPEGETSEPTVTREAPAEETPAAAPVAPTVEEITIRKSGSIWATVAPDGTIRVNGSISGEVGESGNVRVSGMNSGEISADGTIRKSGSIVGSIDADGTLRANGSIVGAIENSGTIRRNGSIWGEATPCCSGKRGRNAVAAVVVFFAGSEFGF